MGSDSFEKWPPIIFFSIVGGLLIFFVYYLAVNTPASNASDVYAGNYLTEVEMIPPESDTIVLKLDREINVRGKYFVYRGVEDSHIRIEVIVPAMDPDVGYMYSVPVEDAEREFLLSGDRFKVDQIRKGTLVILRV